MQFIYPAFLFALAALAIPIIIHLFYFRRFKKVYFTNVRFLKEIKEETSSRSRLRNLLVLLMRLLALSFLVFAFAQPFIPLKDTAVKTGTKAVSIFIDNSFSMEALSEDVALIEKAKQRAREIVDAYAPDDEFQILTNDFEGRHQRLVGRDDALALIEEVRISPAVKELSRVLARQQQTLNTAKTANLSAYLVSDFQRNITDIDAAVDTSIELNLILLQAVQEKNVSIDSAWFDGPVPIVGQPNPLIVQVRNYTDEELDNIRLSMLYDGQNKPVGTLRIPANSTVQDTIQMTVQKTGWQTGELSITDYPVSFDDTYYFAFDVKEVIQVLVINETQSNRYLDAVFGGISNFNLTNQPSQGLDYSQFSNYQLIVCNDLSDISSGLSFELNQYIKNGGNLLVFPGRNANLLSYKNFLATFPANELGVFEEQARDVGQINTSEFVFSDVFENRSANLRLPATQGNFRLSRFGGRGEEVLMSYRDGNSYLSKFQSGEGNLFLCSAPLSDTYNNLVRNGEIFVPMLLKMAISTAKGIRIAYTIDKDEIIVAEHKTNTGGDIVYKLKGQAEEFIPEQRIIGAKVFLSVNNQIPDAGIYDLNLNQDTPSAKYAFNYNRKESELSYYKADELQERFGERVNVVDIRDKAILTAQIAERSQGTILWRWCLILALVFLALEVLLLRFWKA